MSRPNIHHGQHAIHWNENAPIVAALTGLLACVCGVDSIDFDRYVSSDWTHVTCKRCLRHRERIARFTRRTP